MKIVFQKPGGSTVAKRREIVRRNRLGGIFAAGEKEDEERAVNE